MKPHGPDAAWLRNLFRAARDAHETSNSARHRFRPTAPTNPCIGDTGRSPSRARAQTWRSLFVASRTSQDAVVPPSFLEALLRFRQCSSRCSALGEEHERAWKDHFISALVKRVLLLFSNISNGKSQIPYVQSETGYLKFAIW